MPPEFFNNRDKYRVIGLGLHQYHSKFYLIADDDFHIVEMMDLEGDHMDDDRAGS